MKKLVLTSALLFILLLLSCGESAVSMMDPDGGNTLSATDGNPGDPEICHENMISLSDAMIPFYGMTGKFPDSLSELEIIDPELCDLRCPSCDLPYIYNLSSSGEVYTITCPLPNDPNHGFVINGQRSWTPDSSLWPSVCHTNMIRLLYGCAGFYGMYNRYPEQLSELGTSGVMEFWMYECPACGELYQYSTDSTCSTYVIHCPLPWDPGHGYIENGHCSWPPDPSEWPSICHNNMRSLASACAMFYGMEGRYPEELSELGTSGIMGNWDVPCPACGEIYHYSTDPTGQTYLIQCPLPWDPGHGFIKDGIISW